MTRAKLGVPANAIRAEPRSGLGAMALLHPLADPLTLQWRDVVDEQLTFEVVVLVLDTLCEQALYVQFEFGAIQAQGVDSNTFGSCDRLIESRDRQATLGGFLFTGKFRQGGVDEHQRCGVIVADVQDDKANRFTHLGRGQTDTGRVVHGFKHVGCQRSNALVYVCDRLCLRSQPGIGKL